jgi:hypothetical protein
MYAGTTLLLFLLPNLPIDEHNQALSG